jgi:beta-glucanase (GH16 family)
MFRRLNGSLLCILMGALALAGVFHLTRASAASTRSNPSRKAMPSGKIAGYRRVFADNFNGSSLGRCWGKYSDSRIPSSPTGAWIPGDVKVKGGEAVLSASYDRSLGVWASGGMSLAACLTRTYGIYEIRFRIDKAPGVKYAILMWPEHEPWPEGGEIDWAEDAGGNRSYSTLTDIYSGAGGQKEQLPQVVMRANFSRWHTLRLKWAPGRLMEWLDGRRVANIASSHVPSDPMALDIQTETNTDCSPYSTCIDRSTPSVVHMDIAWVVAYAAR